MLAAILLAMSIPRWYRQCVQLGMELLAIAFKLDRKSFTETLNYEMSMRNPFHQVSQASFVKVDFVN